jgi:hypothetical protein
MSKIGRKALDPATPRDRAVHMAEAVLRAAAQFRRFIDAGPAFLLVRWYGWITLI